VTESFVGRVSRGGLGCGCSIGSAGLIRVAVAPDARTALPLHGVWRGRRASYIGMDVEVDISAETAARQPPPLLRVAAGD